MEYYNKSGLSADKSGVFYINSGAIDYDRTKTNYQQAVALADELCELGAQGNISTGGVQLVINDQNRAAVEELLHNRGIQSLHSQTLQAEIAVNGGLDKAAKAEPLGQSAVAREMLRRANSQNPNQENHR